MARFPLAMPPGVYSDGTNYQGKGRWQDSWGVRWYGPALGPIGGYRQKTSSTLTGAPRAALAWKDNGANSWLAVGTHSKLYVMDVLGVVSDITPSGFTAGRADASATGGYGSGTYGSSSYGTPRAGSTQILDATEWTLATWGEDLVGVSPDDRKINLWDTSGGVSSAASAVSGAPSCDAVCVTAERFVFALGTSDPRTVAWSDQEDITTWSPANTNQAGSFPLQTVGRLMCGISVKGATLLLTDTDAHAAQYIGDTDVYGFERVGDSCGAISRQCVAGFNQSAAWMSQSLGFWTWNGAAAVPLDCPVLDYVRRDINLLQMSKVVATVNGANSEIEWRYCSAASNEIDRCVVWNFKYNWWAVGRPSRTCGVDRGAFQYPILVSPTGTIYDHEIGWDYGSDVPFAKTGPIELGNGDNIMHVLNIWPDDITAGDVTASFRARRNQDSAGMDFGPYSMTEKTDVRFSGGIVELTVTGAANTSWRFGIPKLEVRPGEGRG